MSGAILKSMEEEQQNLINKLNSENNEVSFLFGAGISVLAKLPDMKELTKEVQGVLNKDEKDVFEELTKELKAGEHIEHILSFLEEASQLNKFPSVLYKDGKPPYDWVKLTLEIKKAIANIIESRVDLDCKAHQLFAKWLLSRNGVTEIYTTNYDLVLETALENENVFYFDGFVGGISPQFQPAAVDPVMFNVAKEVRPPNTWVRLWKMHGSVNWEAKKQDGKLVVRRNPHKVESCLIYPSSMKYVDSRRLPYIVLQDKFRRSLFSSKMTVVVLGYGFGDEHINEIIFDALERNRNLDVNVLSFVNLSVDHILRKIKNQQALNLTVFSPEQFLYQGVEFSWEGKKKCELGNADTFFHILERSICNHEVK